MLKKTGILLLLFSRIIICNGQCSYNDLLPKANMVVNGDFSAGNTGFTCDYTYSTVNPLSEAKYIITTDASTVHFAFKGYDHTTGTGNFMVLNGWSAPSNVWKQTITVKPNTYYRYAAWLKNIVEKTMYSGAPIATCQLWINSQAVTDTMALPDFPDVWKKLDTLWFSGINTTANLVIKNWGVSLNGNDFAIDDISFKECCTQLQGKPLGNFTLCKGDSVQLQASTGSSFVWVPSIGLNNAATSNPYAKPDSFTRYIATSQYALCTHLDTFDVDVKNCCLSCVSPSDLQHGLIACYPFNGNTKDESGNGNNGTLIGGVSSTNDRFGMPNKAYSFNGSNGYINIPNAASLSSPDKNLTVCFWAYINGWSMVSGTNYASILSKGLTSMSPQYRISLRTDGVASFNKGKYWNMATSYSTLLNQWYYFAVTINDSIISYYRNGVLFGQQNTLATYSYTYINYYLQIGLDEFFNTYFNGKLDDICIYNRTLNAEEIGRLYNLGLINGIFTVNAGSDTTLCKGDSIQLNSTGNGIFLWTPSTGLNNNQIANPYAKPTNSVNYILTVNNSGCMVRDTIQIMIIQVDANAGSDTSICIGDSIQLKGSFTGNSFNWISHTSLSNPAVLNPYVKPATTTPYVLISLNGACIHKDTVIVKAIAVPEVFAGADLWHCYNGKVQLNGIVTNANSFRWAPQKGLNTDTILNPYATVQSKTEYILTAQNGKCESSDTVHVNSMPQINADFDMNPEFGFIPASIQFTNKSKKAFFYRWTFGIPDTFSIKENPRYTYYIEGQYIIWLIIKDSLGCTDSIFKTIEILNKPELNIPNVFTPNGDSYNDNFKINYSEKGFEYLTYEIYNRWGDLLYKAKFPGGKWWDGIYKGNPSPEGVYFYIIEAMDITKKKYNLHGSLTLMK
ncbi:MAG: LamG-like jellyroll fold domain-containing protein [Bacteroidota bacterium]|nr:LamG-like jellyroll fold domain-containing protein [Bacteroidota bacterium]